MKTLYESILDDEDVLIGNSIKDTQNPFIILANLSDDDWCNEDMVLDIIKQLEFPKYVLQGKEKIPFNKECLGVKSYTVSSGMNICEINYDRSRVLKYAPDYKENRFPPIILYIKTFEVGKKGPDFLINSKIIADLGYRLDVKDVFRSVTPLTSILKKWSKKYNIRIDC